MQWMSSINGTQAASGGRDGLMGPPAAPPSAAGCDEMFAVGSRHADSRTLIKGAMRRRRSHVVAAAAMTPLVVVAHDNDEFLVK